MGFFDFFKKEQKSKPEVAEERIMDKKPETTESNHTYISVTEPDTPIPFGYNNAWMAIKNTTPEQVIECMQLKNVQVSNWETGIDGSYNDKWFITPSVDGYVIVAGVVDYAEHEDKLAEIAQKFEEVLFFATHRVVDLSTWSKYRNGQKIRRYYYLGETGEVSSEGVLTQEELELGFGSLMVSEDENWDDVELADEEMVMEISKAWGVDTSFESHQDEVSTGYLADAL